MKNHLLIIVCLLISIGSPSQTTDAAGKKQGYWKKTEEKTNKLIYEGLFKDDKPQGVFKYYYPFDSVKAIIDFKKDGAYAYAKLFHPNGKLMAKGKYLGESVKDSVWLFYDEAEVLMSKEIYLKGKKHGKFLVYFPNGKIAEERNFIMDQQNGAFKQYFESNNVKCEGTYANGNLEGKNTYFYPNGVAAATGYYKNGLRNGPWIYKDKDGKINEKQLYEHGQLAGPKKTEEFFSKNKVKEETPVKTPQKTVGAKPAPKKN